MRDDEFFKERGNASINVRKHGAVIKKDADGKWQVGWLMSEWKMEDLGRVYRKLKELNNE